MNMIYLIVIHQPLRHECFLLPKSDSLVGIVAKYNIDM